MSARRRAAIRGRRKQYAPGGGYNTDYVHVAQDTLELTKDVAVGGTKFDLP